MQKVKEAIHDYAKANGKTIDDVASELEIGRTSLFNKMRGDFDFTLHEGYKLSRMFGCTMDEFYEMTKR